MNTPEMDDRCFKVGGVWHPEGGGYFSLVGFGGFATVAYLAIPTDHPLVGKDDDELEEYGPDVNGGITFTRGNVFGWDYGHYRNDGSPPEDIASALRWFRERAIPKLTSGPKLLGRGE